MRAKDLWADHPVIDVVGACIIATLMAIFLPVTQRLAATTRVELYSAEGAIVALVGGLGAIAIATYTGGSGRRMKKLKQDAGPSLRRNFAWAIASTTVSAFTAWAAIIVDAYSVTVAWGMAVGAAILCALTAARQVWLVSGLISVADVDDQRADAAAARPSRPIPVAGSRWGANTPDASRIALPS